MVKMLTDLCQVYQQTIPALVNHPGHTAFFFFLGSWSIKRYLQRGREILWTKGVLWDVGSCVFNTSYMVDLCYKGPDSI